MRTATCDVCTAYIADVLPVPGIAPDGTQKDDRIGDLRIVCDDCEKAYEVIVRSKGVQPPDGTTEPVAWLIKARKPGTWAEWASICDDGSEAWPLDQGWVTVTRTPLVECGPAENILPAKYAVPEARANVAEPSMSTTSPSADSGTDRTIYDDVTAAVKRLNASIEGGAKP